ncbi:hypothetical protein MUU72_08235 [Streptomyces sp. RS10V-4]|uniref:hypothetical protein n=1 Tax=Streptomyces rhizoryzae TaxID=2932493 RepID=UPI002006D17A|nr:hypothetical protein [Streptomyces rhizoryzae]MCK7623086.1 hypothetical protein [Streptomyces rhizoryzae]
MKPARPAAAALLGLLALTAAAPPARAGTVPGPVVAGERVSITDGGRCGSVPAATARSDLFGSVPLRPGARGLAADVPVAEETEPGRYRITIDCGPSGPHHVLTVTVTEGRPEGVGAAQAAGGLVLLALAGVAAYRLRR